MYSIALDSRVVNMLQFYEYVVLLWDLRVVNMLRFECIRSMILELIVVIFEILFICSITLDSRVVNMLDFTHVFYCLGFESGRHAKIAVNSSYYFGFESC